MPTITDQAVCIRHWDFSETSQTVSLFARDHGMIRGLAKGARREKGSFSGGIDLLTRGEVVAIVKPSRELANLTAWHLEEIFWSLRRSLAANRIGMYMADLVHRMVSAHDPHPALWDAMVAGLRRLEDPDDGERTLLAYQLALLAETGYQPELDRDAETGGPLPAGGDTLAFSPRHGGVVADRPEDGGRWRVRRATIETLRVVGGGGEADDGDAVIRANRLLAAWIREILGEQPPSMRWAFDEL